ncbi:hypothetical protein [Flexithrix dorotheae]|uniref:hypothetical protein n=1 Tax=Flexithrix dorotheae TaxID=70993 RepID=UPI00146D32E5|nr:hypothetical protein [Flexithrix dorotheae]
MSKLLIGIMVIANFISCNDEDEPQVTPISQPVKIQFGEDDSIPENGGSKEIFLQFDKAAPSDGEITLEVESDFPDDFETSPEIAENLLKIPIEKGKKTVSFDFIPVNNSVLGSDRAINFKILELSKGFEPGIKNSLKIILVEDEERVTASFSEASSSLLETELKGTIIQINLSGPAPGEGSITLKIEEGFQNGNFQTEPKFNSEGKLKIVVPLGATTASFQVTPIHNNVLSGHQLFKFSISETEGAITKGELNKREFTILDNELVGKPKSYEVIGGNWKSRKTFFYEASGKIEKIEWETETPGKRTGTDTYYYNIHGQIEKINHFPNHDEYFYYEDGRVTRSEEIENGEKSSYKEYDYDPAGNIGGEAVYYKQSSGEFKLGFVFVFLYFDNGNLYKQLTYIPVDTEEEYELISTRTFDNYNSSSNPFPVEIVPTIAAQKQLPGSYQLEENGFDITYNFSYTFDENGHLATRSASSSSGGESTTYSFY